MLRERVAVGRVVVVVFAVVVVVESTYRYALCVSLLREVKQQIAAEFNVRLNGDLVRAARRSQCGEFAVDNMPLHACQCGELSASLREQENGSGDRRRVRSLSMVF